MTSWSLGSWNEWGIPAFACGLLFNLIPYLKSHLALSVLSLRPGLSEGCILRMALPCHCHCQNRTHSQECFTPLMV